MPRMDGLEATRRIRASDGPNQETPIIGLTAHLTTEKQEQFQDAGLDGCITKPIRLQALYDALGLEMPTKINVPDADETLSSSQVIDDRIFDELVQTLPPERVEKIVRQVCREVEAEIPRIIEDSISVTEVSGRAHKLAGSAAIVGAESLVELLRDIETAGKVDEPGKMHAAKQSLPKVGQLTTAELLRRLSVPA